MFYGFILAEVFYIIIGANWTKLFFFPDFEVGYGDLIFRERNTAFIVVYYFVKCV